MKFMVYLDNCGSDCLKKGIFQFLEAVEAMTGIVFPYDFVVVGKQVEERLVVTEEFVIAAQGEVEWSVVGPSALLVQSGLAQENLFVEVAVYVKVLGVHWILTLSF